MRIPQPLFADDDGSPDPGLGVALVGGNPYEVAAALAKARIFIALQADLDSASVNLEGVKIEQQSHLSLTWLTTKSAQALPVFTSVARLAEWNPLARPLGVESARAATAAAAEGAVLIVDPGAEQAHEVSRAAVRAIASGYEHLPLWLDPVVKDALGDALDAINDGGRMLAASLSEGHEEADLVVSLQISAPPLSESDLAAFLDHFTSDERLRSRLELGLEVRVLR